jgi:protein-tyrosine phosphatase
MSIKWLAAFLVAYSAGSALAQETHLKHFTQVDEHVFAGSKPTTAEDFEFLRSKGVKFILQANFLPGMKGGEKERAAKYGIEYFSVPMNASPVPPLKRHVNRALRIMRTHQPIYLHCVLGRDRTGLLAGLYKMYFDGLSKEDAYAFMRKEGFRDGFFLRGLKTYFDKNTAFPAELSDLKTR